jgi:hypothetical protein
LEDTVRKILMTFGLAIALVAGLMAGPAFAGGGPTRLHATMTGAKVQPGPGDQDGLGRGQFKVNLSRDQFCFHIGLENTADVTGGHVFEGAPGETGPAVVDLQLDDNGGKGCVAVAHAILAAIAMNPHDYYVQVSTVVFPNGAVRGQLVQH